MGAVHRLGSSTLTGLLTGLLLVVGACASGQSGGASTTTNRTLVVDKSFDLKTADPQREFEVSGGVVAKGLYDTLLTFKGPDVTTPVPAVASSYTASSDATTYTFKLRSDIKFSDGTPLTSADVAFSFNRLINIKGNPSFLLDGVTVSAPDSSTVVLKSKEPNPALPFIIPNPALGIVNSKVVKAHGGTDQPRTSPVALRRNRVGVPLTDSVAISASQLRVPTSRPAARFDPPPLARGLS